MVLMQSSSIVSKDTVDCDNPLWSKRQRLNLPCIYFMRETLKHRQLVRMSTGSHALAWGNPFRKKYAKQPW